MNVLMLYPRFPEETFWNTGRAVKLLWGRKAIMPPLGLLTIASYLPEDFSLRLIDRNVAEESESDWQWADVVFISLMVAQREDYVACLAQARRRGKPVAVGGPFTHAMPEVACADADWVCFGEAENIMADFVDDLRAGRRKKRYDGGSSTDMARVKIPRFDLLPDINDYATMALQFSRGCPFRCEFCDIIEIYGRVPRTKTAAQLCAELARLKELGFRGYIFLVDDNFIGNKKNAKIMLAELSTWNRAQGWPFRYYTEASINVADDDELLERMSRAGFFHVFIGIETPDPKLLKSTQKLQNIPGKPLEKLNKIRGHGIHITAGFIVGFDGEERGVFGAQESFIRDSGVGVAMIGLLQAIPHTQLSRRLKEEGRLLEKLDLSGSLTVEGINFIPRGEMTKRDYLEGYRALVREVYSPKNYFTRILPALLDLRMRVPSGVLRRHGWTLIKVLLKEIYHLGLKAKETRAQFWKTFLPLLRNNPAALEAFAFDTSVFYHLHRHAAYVNYELEKYLSAPSCADVLDEVSGGRECPRN
ncbi:MAG: B12-binding domain-containing radical SAM protein [Alphaproteobacteria bacterium]